MTQLSAICEFLAELAPPVLAEDWDNVGLLAGDPLLPVRGIMTCLTITPHTAEEAIDRDADLVVTHHPLPFQPIRRLGNRHVAGTIAVAAGFPPRRHLQPAHGVRFRRGGDQSGTGSGARIDRDSPAGAP
jgi:hypothetical protein